MNKLIKIKIRLKLYFTEKLVESFHYLLIFWTQWIPKQTILISVPRTDANNHLIVWSVLFSLCESMVTRKSHFILYRHCTLRHQKTSKYLSSENFTPFQVTNTLKILLIFSKVLLTEVWTPPPPPHFFCLTCFIPFFQCLSGYSFEGGWWQRDPSTRFWF